MKFGAIIKRCGWVRETGQNNRVMEGEEEAPPQQQYNPYQMNPGMMGGYGYGMGPHMMQQQQQQIMQQQQAQAAQQQYPPYGMHPNMMGYGGGYGYPMGQHMMGSYGMHPGMMGGYGYPPMMGPGWGHNPMHRMGGWNPPCTQGPKYGSAEDHTKFMDDTREDRRKLHNLMFDYGEAQRSPEPDREKLQAMQKEIFELREKIFSQKFK